MMRWFRTRTGLIIRLALSALLIVHSVLPAMAQGTEREINPELARKNLAEAFTLIEKLKAEIDSSQNDPEALLDTLNYEAEDITRFVTEEISFEPYTGLLRGPAGTLIGRAGNALDQSVLLAKLLKDAGYDARIRGGKLKKSDAARVLQQTGKGKPATNPVFQSDEYKSTVAELSELLGMDARQAEGFKREYSNHESNQSSDIAAAALETAKLIKDTLTENGIKTTTPGLIDALAREAEAYYWVEFREGAAKDWTTIQPVFSDQDPIDPLPKPTVTLVDEIPPELQHRIRIQVFIEQKLGDQLITHELTEALEKPTANLHAVPITFSNIPERLSGGVEGFPDADTVIGESSYFLPNLTGDSFSQVKAFDLRGNTIDQLVTNRAEAGVFKEVNRAFSSAAGSLGGEGDTVSLLTAQWLELTFIEPGGEEYSVRRFTYDAIGPAKRVNAKLDNLVREVPYPLLQRHTLMSATGEISRAQELIVSLDSLLDLRHLLETLIQVAEHPDMAEKLTVEMMNKMPAHWTGMTSLMAQLGAADQVVPGRVVYRHRPAMTIVSEGLVANDKIGRTIDIVSNHRRVLDTDSGQLLQDTSAGIALGSWDTHVETAVLSDGSNHVEGAPAATHLAVEQDIPMMLVQSTEDVNRLAVDPDEKFHIQKDIDRGFIAVMPSSKPDGIRDIAWWRVNPETGETLGMGIGGRGVSTTESAILLTLSLFSLAVLYYSWYECFQDLQPGNEGSLRFICCLIYNFAAWGVGAGLGKMFAYVAGALFSLTWDTVTYNLDPCS